MSSNNIEYILRGQKDVIRALRKAGEKSREYLLDALEAGSDVFLAAAKANAPVRTGYLREHLGVKVAFDDKKGVVTVIGGTTPGGKGGNLAYWQEYGTSKQAARPFMRPAFDAAKLPAEAAIIATLKRKLKL